MQKSIRRGLEEEALYWASELELQGFGNYVWKRLRLICTEDVGLGETFLAATIRALYENWKDAKSGGNGQERIFMVHAIVLLARARKSYLVSNAFLATYFDERPPREVPDYALDMHTKAGRQMGRGFEHFFAVGGKLVDELEIEDPYEERAQRAMLAKEATKRRRPRQMAIEE